MYTNGSFFTIITVFFTSVQDEAHRNTTTITPYYYSTTITIISSQTSTAGHRPCIVLEVYYVSLCFTADDHRQCQLYFFQIFYSLSDHFKLRLFN